MGVRELANVGSNSLAHRTCHASTPTADEDDIVLFLGRSTHWRHVGERSRNLTNDDDDDVI